MTASKYWNLFPRYLWKPRYLPIGSFDRIVSEIFFGDPRTENWISARVNTTLRMLKISAFGGLWVKSCNVKHEHTSRWWGLSCHYCYCQLTTELFIVEWVILSTIGVVTRGTLCSLEVVVLVTRVVYQQPPPSRVGNRSGKIGRKAIWIHVMNSTLTSLVREPIW